MKPRTVPARIVSPLSVAFSTLSAFQVESVEQPWAQWMLESGRATSILARDHYNFGGLKWRKEMVPYATKIKYVAHDGEDFYCKFALLKISLQDIGHS